MSTKIISGSNLGLATQISDTLQIPLTSRKITHFRNGEICVSIQESVRNHDVFIVQTKGPSQSTNDMLMELLILIDACRRSAAKSIYVVLPCYPYSRQDKKEESREPITAKLVAKQAKLPYSKSKLKTESAHIIFFYEWVPQDIVRIVKISIKKKCCTV